MLINCGASHENAKVGRDKFAYRIVASSLGSRLRALKFEYERAATRLAQNADRMRRGLALHIQDKYLKPSNGKKWNYRPRPGIP